VLAPGGKLLYATCSLFPTENGQQISAFLVRHSEARVSALKELGDGQILPDRDRDGFFYALLEKRAP
jgi:16S rRNA (cytosine967-C5)-methyltransferase